MATSPLGGFANLSRYQQAAVQPQANIMDQFIQSLNQGISLGQLPQTLQAEAEKRQRDAILGQLDVALQQQRVKDALDPAGSVANQLQLANRNAQIARQDELMRRELALKFGTGQIGGQVTPAMEEQRRIAFEQGGIPVPQTFDIGGGFKLDPVLGQQFEQDKRRQELADIIAKTGGVERARQEAQFPFERDLLTQKQTGQTDQEKLDFANKMATLQKQHDLAVSRDNEQEKNRLANEMTLLKQKNDFEIEQAKSGIGKGAKAPTSEQQRAGLYGKRAFEAEQSFKEIFGQGFDPTAVNPLTSPLQVAGNVLEGISKNPVVNYITPTGIQNTFTRASRQRFDQAKRNFLNAVLRRESGAVISPSEFEEGNKQYFPQAADSDSLLLQKEQNRQTVIESLLREGSGQPVVSQQEAADLLSGKKQTTTPKTQEIKTRSGEIDGFTFSVD